MTKYSSIQDLGVVQIDTEPHYYQQDPGLAGVAILNPGPFNKLQSYTSTDSVAKDYGTDGKLYREAVAYFNNPGATLFQIITYSGGNGPQAVDGATINSGTQTSPSAQAPAFAVSAVSQFYGADWEHLIVNVNVTTKDVAIQVAEFMEAQHNKLCWLEIPVSDQNSVDFSFLKELNSDPDNDNKGMLSTVAFSTTEDTTINYDAAGALLGVYAPKDPGYDPMFITGLEDFSAIVPQDQYNFTKGQLDNTYTPYNVWTYAYRNGIPMFTSNYSLGGYEIMPMLTRDAIIKDVKKNILNLFIQNGGVQYNAEGVRAIQAQIKVTLDDFEKRGLIKNSQIIPIDPDKISERIKATGHLSGLGWTWQPVWGINEATFKQEIEMPELS